MGVGLLGAVVLFGIAWSVQLIGLPPPAQADLVTARAARWLNDYRTAIADFEVGHRRVEGICIHGSPGDRHGEPSKSSVLVLTGGQTFHVTQIRAEERVVDESGRQTLPEVLAANVACTHQLLVEIAEATRANPAIDTAPARVAGQPAIALRLAAARQERLTLYVTPSTYLPLGASAVIGGRRMTARLRLTQLGHTQLAGFSLPSRRP